MPKDLVPNGEVLPAHSPDMEVSFWRRPVVRIGGGAILLWTVAAWLASQFFTLRGYVNIAASRIVLILCVLCVISWIWIWARNIQKPRLWLPFFASIGVICLGVALDQLTLPGRASGAAPDIKLDLQHGITVIATDPGSGNTLFLASGAIINRGPETATTDWQMWLDHLSDGMVLHGSMIPNIPSDSDIRIKYPSLNGTFVAQPSKFWPELTSQPMKMGSVNMGWVWCEFPITLRALDKQEQSAILHVQFQDVASGKAHEATVAMNTASRFTNPPWFPKPSNKGAQR